MTLESQIEQSPVTSPPEVAGDVAREDAAPRTNRPRRILVLSPAFPSSVMPTFGIFVKERIRALANLPGYEIRVIAPVPYFPPLKRFEKWYAWSQMPRQETIDGLEVIRPRYPLPPKIGGYLHSYLMYPSVLRAAKRLRREFDFDLIDAHFAYPAGVVGTMLARRLKKPVMITGRGEDIHRFPELPVIGKRIRWALQHADRLVGVSSEIAEKMKRLGATTAHTQVIGNGVDCEKFQPQSREDARKKLGLPPAAQIVVSVGDCFENKGFHLLIDAVAQLKESHPDLHAVIVGGPPRYGTDYTSVLEQRIEAHGLQDRIHLAGRCQHADLPSWYSAADVFALLSAREGSPNVMMEALACGIPAMGTPVGGIPEILNDERLGIVLPERSAAAAATTLETIFSRSWNHDEIRQIMEQRDWQTTAKRLDEIIGELL